ncbi:MAG: hypothetical protein INR70_01365 [Parafilimonas terrae]|nr:hypothetical protein [Parafilimonas terrae]
MHFLRFSILFGLIASSPVAAAERLAHLQPAREPMLLHVSISEALKTPASAYDKLDHDNQASKSKQDAFNQKNDLASVRLIKSICRYCLDLQTNNAAPNPKNHFNSSDGSLVSAEWIYSRASGFDPALAGGSRQR